MHACESILESNSASLVCLMCYLSLEVKRRSPEWDGTRLSAPTHREPRNSLQPADVPTGTRGRRDVVTEHTG